MIAAFPSAAISLLFLCQTISLRAFWTAPKLRSHEGGTRKGGPTFGTSTTALHEQAINIRKLLGDVSPATLSGYNLPRDVLDTGWTAEVVTKTAKGIDEATSVRLAPRNETHYVDSHRLDVPLTPDSPGLGIELLEVEGGREDGLGIVIVSGLVAGGNAERASAAAAGRGREGVMYGDSIASAALTVERSGGRVDVTTVATECLGYDRTVDALVGMLSALSDADRDGGDVRGASVRLTLKRMRRRPDVRVELRYPPSQGLEPRVIRLRPGDNLRTAMLQRGVVLNDELALRYDGKGTNSGNCGSGGLCRTCAVSVLRGGELLSEPKMNERRMMQDNPRWRLACKSWVGRGMKEGTVVVQVNPRQWV
mmetsp:Transcript_4190/g.9380  ORF Transcript_4190/g.9380 Transcript_4190/m.9380 type:complete len:366 (+) Transcript_4190:69-1166(+)